MIKNTRNYGNKWTDRLFRNFTFCEMREKERERKRERERDSRNKRKE